MSDIALPDTLTFEEVVELETLEATIDEGLDSFIRVGNALLQVRDRRLYREQYRTFEAYCQAKRGLGDRRARQIMQAAGVINWLEDENRKNVSAPEQPEPMLLPANESQARALGQFDRDLQPAIMRVASARAETTGQTVTAGLIKLIGENLTEAATTGHVDMGDGESTPFEASISVADRERVMRQDEHIKERSEAKSSQGQWKDHLGELEPDDQALVRDVHRDITSNYGEEKSLQAVALDAKRLAKTDTWAGADADQKREMLHERFSEKMERTTPAVKPKPQTTPDDLESLKHACANLLECVGSDKVNSFVREHARNSLETVNEIMGRFLA